MSNKRRIYFLVFFEGRLRAKKEMSQILMYDFRKNLIFCLWKQLTKTTTSAKESNCSLQNNSQVNGKI